MLRRRLGLMAAISAAALLAGCASTATSAQAPAAATTAAPESSRPAAPAASATKASPSTSAAEPHLPDGYDPTRNAGEDIRAALRQATRDHRAVLLDFGANWCPDCQVLDKLFRSQQVEPLLRRDYHVVAVDVGKFDHNLDLAADFVNLQTSGIPALVVLAPDGNVRTATDDGAFSNARTMSPAEVSAFLTRWATAGDR
ncbi:thioredoxin family protein [Peterkaempfera sp. SMS 1(5)a]|uniref:thioredoxin family protein n=1 Tax=Peterkaempfera podocarpi TaxID=3232308 RepID=UPI00366BC6AC